MNDTMRPALMADDTQDADTSDFLYHLYRGAELLQDNLVHQAKSELETALRLQPKQPRGQDLLAIVYFRLKRYPRAIEIYQSLVRDFPDDVTPRVNLALCYLKNDQAHEAARELQQVVQAAPTHPRAWGYLGLALQQQGDYENARRAFERSGHKSMIRRMSGLIERDETREQQDRMPRPTPEQIEAVSMRDWDELRRIAQQAFDDLDASQDAFHLAPVSRRGEADAGDKWVALEPGQGVREAIPIRTEKTAFAGDTHVAGPRAFRLGEDSFASTQEPIVVQGALPMSKNAGNRDTSNHESESVTLSALEQRNLVDCTTTQRVSRVDEGSLYISVKGQLCVCVDLVRVIYAKTDTRRRAGTSQLEDWLGCRSVMYDQPGKGAVALGSAGRGLKWIIGASGLILQQREGCGLLAVALDKQCLFVRQDCVVGFDDTLEYDCWRLDIDEVSRLDVVRLRGSGLVLLEFGRDYRACKLVEETDCVLRLSSLLAWSGRIVGRGCTVAAVDAPGIDGSSGWCRLSGQGTIWFDARGESGF